MMQFGIDPFDRQYLPYRADRGGAAGIEPQGECEWHPRRLRHGVIWCIF
jgi:hypothetical protein